MSEDTISRQAAINVADYTDCPGLEIEVVKKVTDEVVKGLKQLPPAQPERKRGKWIIEYDPGSEWYKVTCSECGEDMTCQIPLIGFFPDVKALWNYCPECGADNRPKTTSEDMRGEEHG